MLHVYLALPRLLGGGEAKAWEQVKAIKEISDFEGIMAALFFSAAGDVENINKQARNARADWVKSSGRAKWVNDVENMPTKQAAETSS